MTTLTHNPIAKLYKRCARNRHDTCPGSFETWSVCSCPCHAGVSDERPAPAGIAAIFTGASEEIYENVKRYEAEAQAIYAGYVSDMRAAEVPCANASTRSYNPL